MIVDKKGNTEDVSLKTLFENAHHYVALGGDTQTQNFAVLRVILAVLHTVFSRFDASGEPYSVLYLDGKMRPLGIVEDEDDREDYLESMMETWEDLWKQGVFPDIIQAYLDMWSDRFFLLHDEFPFFQVCKEDVAEGRINQTKPSEILGKNINRLVSESANKPALFSPKYQKGYNKEKMSLSEMARWLITFQGYSGLGDKTIFKGKKYVKKSKGWLFDLGGLFFSGGNLFETLLLNLPLVHPEEQYQGVQQRPSWEVSSKENLSRYFPMRNPDNLAELYTIWSRAIYISPDLEPNEGVCLGVVKLPAINLKKFNLEPMTIWREKSEFIPRKHVAHQALWRSFGLFATPNQPNKSYLQPGIMSWLYKIHETIGDYNITVNAVSMQDDGNPMACVPTDEIIDNLRIQDFVLTEISDEGWALRIEDTVEETKRIIERTYKNFISDLRDIRNISSSLFVNQHVEQMYFLIDQPFRDWLSSIRVNDLKSEKIFEWREILRKLVLNQAERIIAEAGPRDYTGIVADEADGRKETKNIAISYRRFRGAIYRQLPKKEADS